MLKTEKKELINIIFSKQEMFEKYILGVETENDRQEIMLILSKMIVRVLLKEELNFLYMKELDNLNLSIIINILFKELANEWVFFAEDRLGNNKDESLKEIQGKERVLFLLNITKSYFEKYKIYFAQEIANTFLDLIDSMSAPTLNNFVIKQVLKSNFVKNKNISVVYNYNQLWNRVKDAHNYKNREITKIQVKISELVKEENFDLAKKFEYEEEVLTEKPLSCFEEAVKRLRDTMVDRILELKEPTTH